MNLQHNPFDTQAYFHYLAQLMTPGINPGFSLLADEEIAYMVENFNMIDNFSPRFSGEGIMSWGLDGHGYDTRLGFTEAWVTSTAGRSFSRITEDGLRPDPLIDPLNSKALRDNMVHIENLREKEVIIPPHGFLLGVSYERFNMPPDVTGLCIGKSSYARCGISIPMTPLEPGWHGYATIEVVNNLPYSVRVFPGQGIMKVLFFRSEVPDCGYVNSEGKYQDQEEKVVFSK